MVAGLQAFNRSCFQKQVLCSKALEHHGCAGFKRNVVWQFANALGGHHALFAITAWGLAGIGRAIAYLEVRDALAHGLDNARGFHAQLQRHGQSVQTAALVNVDEVQANGFVANANLARAGLAHRNVNQFELFWATVLVDLDS